MSAGDEVRSAIISMLSHSPSLALEFSFAGFTLPRSLLWPLITLFSDGLVMEPLRLPRSLTVLLALALIVAYTSGLSIVIPPASTGSDNNNNTAVITTAQPNKVILCGLIPLVLMLHIVTIKLIDPNRELTPVRCNVKIAKSTLGPL